MKIAVVTPCISRLAGGLFESVRAIAIGAESTGNKVQIFSNYDQFTDADARHWNGLDVHLHTTTGPQSFGYSRGLLKSLYSGNPDVVHCHGIWMYPSMASRQWSRASGHPLIISPHGMLDPWAVKNSFLQKFIAGLLYEKRNLRHAACIHALCESEYESIRSFGLSNPVAVIPNGIHLNSVTNAPGPPPWVRQLEQGSRTLLFLGRIHPKKGLHTLIAAWSKFKNCRESQVRNWNLVIAGWDQGGYQGHLQDLVHKLEVSSSIHFIGPQFDEEKAACLSHADAFILPSLSEGLPMSVLEAWAYGLPVLMTEECNLPEGFVANAARNLGTDSEGILQSLIWLANEKDSNLLEIGARGRKLVEENFTWSSVSAAFIEVYNWAINRGNKPNCVRFD